MSRGEILKSAVASLSAGYQLPAAGPSLATALISQNRETTMNHASRQAIDAYSASPALRLRFRVLSAKAAQRSPLAAPPDVRPTSTSLGMGLAPQPSYYARLAGDPRAVLMRLREEAADEIDRLLGFLDATDGDVDMEPSLAGFSDGMDDREGVCEDEGAQCDDEGYEESGVGDTDGLMEQVVAFNGQLLAGFGTSGFAHHVE